MKKFTGLLVGLIFLAAGIFLFIKNDRLTKVCTKETIATVVDMYEDMSSDEDGIHYVYYPIIEYKVDRNTYHEKMSSGSSNPKYRVNDKLTILYNPDKPKEFIIKGEKDNNIFSIAFIALGVLVTGYGTVMIFKKDN